VLLRLLARLFATAPASRNAAIEEPPPPDTLDREAAALASGGDLHGAADGYLRAIDAWPDNAALRVNASNILKRLGRTPEARAHLEEAVRIAPQLTGARYNLAILLQETFFYLEAADEYREVLRQCETGGGTALLEPAIIGLGAALLGAGQARASREFLDAMSQTYPRLSSDIARNALFTWVGDTEASPAEVRGAHEAWAARYCDAWTRDAPFHTNTPEPERRLRVGYVSGDFRAHAVAWFFEHLLEHRDVAAVEVFCYDNTASTDTTSSSLRSHSAHWREIAGDDDATVAQRIRADGIDILIDLSGHTSRNRLDVFARKPAPIQMTWLGYPLTTGMAAMDYRICDAMVDPPGISESWYREQLVRLPDCAWCFREPLNSPGLSAAPALRNGYLTFASFNQINKINDAVIDVWSSIMRALPTSRLLIARMPQGRARDELIAHWRERGLDVTRVDLHGFTDRAGFLELHALADVALDPFPCNGGTTTCETLWMGLPVITLAGTAGAARAGASILNAANLSDWIAQNTEEYLRIAGDLAADPHELSLRRLSLREHLRQSPLMTGARFTRHFEAALRSVWRDWCAAQKAM
jgi:protein O-GlcNAc transferase